MAKRNGWYIKAEGVEVGFGDQTLFTLQRLEIYPGDRIGVVGANGAGKTTLLNLLYGAISPRKGSIARNGSISYFKQLDQGDVEEVQNGKLKKELGLVRLAGQNAISGGENTRVRLADVLSGKTNVVFVDEPTANLDRSGITLVRHKLEQIETFVLISHDRAVLAPLCNRIVEIEEQTATVYDMGYEEYRVVKKEEQLAKSREYEEYVQERNRLTKVYQGKKKKAQDIGKKPTNISRREARLRNFLASRPYDCKQLAMERQAKAVKSRLDHLEKKEKPKELPKIQLEFVLTNPPSNRRVIKVESLTYRYGAKTVLDNVSLSIRNGAKAAIIGDNGAGKTTLLRAIVERAEGVSVVPKAKIGYFHQQFEQLNLEKTVLENVMQDSIQKEEVARGVLARLLLGERFLEQSVSSLSGGERVRLAIAKLLVSDANVLLLDEPTNYLDMPSVEAVTEVLREYEGTVLVVSHEEAFLDAIATSLIMVDKGHVTVYNGTMEEYKNRSFRTAEEEKRHMELQALEMRMVELISRLSMEKEKGALEKEYEEVLQKLQTLRTQG